jgi:hypothetical protein
VPSGDGEPAVDVAEEVAEAARPSRRRRITGQVGGTVLAMGAVSFLTDASAEMVTAVLPGGPRAVVDVACERVYAVAAGGFCLTAHRGVVTTYQGQLLGPDLRRCGT